MRDPRPIKWTEQTTSFHSLSHTDEMLENFNGVDDMLSYLEDHLRGAADATIPKMNTTSAKPPIPRWNRELANARRERNRRERVLRSRYSIENKIETATMLVA